MSLVEESTTWTRLRDVSSPDEATRERINWTAHSLGRKRSAAAAMSATRPPGDACGPRPKELGRATGLETTGSGGPSSRSCDLVRTGVRRRGAGAGAGEDSSALKERRPLASVWSPQARLTDSRLLISRNRLRAASCRPGWLVAGVCARVTNAAEHGAVMLVARGAAEVASATTASAAGAKAAGLPKTSPRANAAAEEACSVVCVADSA